MDVLQADGSWRNVAYCTRGADAGGPLDIQLLDRNVFDSAEEPFVEKARQCVFKSALEGHFHIFRYVCDSSGDWDARVAFQESTPDKAALRIESREVEPANVVTFCGDCIAGLVVAMKEPAKEEDEEEDPYEEENPAPTEEEVKFGQLRFLLDLLDWLKSTECLEHLRKIIQAYGLSWTGAWSSSVWDEGECTGRLEELVIDFLVENRAELRDVLIGALEGRGLKREHLTTFVLSQLALYAPNSFKKLVDATLDEGDSLERMLFPSLSRDENVDDDVPVDFWNLHQAWHHVVQLDGESEVRQMWEYWERKVGSSERARRFLLEKDHKGRGVVFAATCNRWNPLVIHFFWDLLGKLFETPTPGQEVPSNCSRGRKQILFDSVSGVVPYELKPDVFLDFLFELLECGELDGEEVTRLLLSEDKYGDPFILDLSEGSLWANTVYRLQDLLSSGKLDTVAILTAMQGEYRSIVRDCFEGDFAIWPQKDSSFFTSPRSTAAAELELVSPASPLNWLDRSLLDERVLGGYLVRTDEGEMLRVDAIRLKVFYTLMRRQASLELLHLPAETALERLAGDWMDSFYRFSPRLQRPCTSDDTHAYFVLHFANAVSPALSREQLAYALFLHGDDPGSAFFFTLDEDDLPAFKALYDVSRSVFAEEALSTVHSFKRSQEGHWMLLHELLEKQDEVSILDPLVTEEEAIGGLGAVLCGLGDDREMDVFVRPLLFEIQEDLKAKDWLAVERLLQDVEYTAVQMRSMRRHAPN